MVAHIVPCSTDYWHALTVMPSRLGALSRVTGRELMLATLKREVPGMCSITFTRACNLQCSHCIYRKEASSKALSMAAGLPQLVLRAVEQLPGLKPRLLHEGRILEWWHAEVMLEALRRRPELQLGLIDNGTYVRLLEQLVLHGFRLDWFDISIDGDEQIHNTQRRSSTAYRDAIRGLEHARQITKLRAAGGRVTSLFTVTSVNHDNLVAAAQAIFEPRGREAYIDEFHVTTVSPARRELEGMEQKDFSVFFAQVQEVYRRYGQEKGVQRVFFRLYRHHELLKLAAVVGAGEVLEAFEHGVRLAPGEVYFTLRGLPFVYSPLSIWPGETFLIDADGTYRTAYSIGHTLAQLRTGVDEEGNDLRDYSVETLRPDFVLKDLYERCVDQWWGFRGEGYLEEETRVFEALRR